MSSRKQGQTQEGASAKAGVSERSGRRIEDGRISVLEDKERPWRTRKDPFAEVWDSDVVALLERQPALDATTVSTTFGSRSAAGATSPWCWAGSRSAPWQRGCRRRCGALGGAVGAPHRQPLGGVQEPLGRDPEGDLTERYEELCAHLRVAATRNNRGVSHENGAVESPHGHIKRRIAQALLLRESSDFASIEDYRQWLDALVGRCNRRCAEALAI